MSTQIRIKQNLIAQKVKLFCSLSPNDFITEQWISVSDLSIKEVEPGFGNYEF